MTDCKVSRLITVRHKRTGNIYIVVGEALDCTNLRGGHEAGRIMLVYKQADGDRLYVRDKGEFDLSFEAVK